MKRILLILSFLLPLAALAQTYYPIGVTNVPSRPYFLGNAKVKDTLGIVGKSYLYGYSTAFNGFMWRKDAKNMFASNYLYNSKEYFGWICKPTTGSINAFGQYQNTAITLSVQDSALLVNTGTLSITANSLYMQSKGRTYASAISLRVDTVHGFLYNSGPDTASFLLKTSTTTSAYRRGFGPRFDGANGYLWNYENGAIYFGVNNVKKWTITSTGTLESNGAQTIQTSTGDLELRTSTTASDININAAGKMTVATDTVEFTSGTNYLGTTSGALDLYTGSNGNINLAPNGTGIITASNRIQFTGADTLQTQTGNLTLATGAANGNITISPHGTGSNYINGNLFQQKVSAANDRTGFIENRDGRIILGTSSIATADTMSQLLMTNKAFKLSNYNIRGYINTLYTDSIKFTFANSNVGDLVTIDTNGAVDILDTLTLSTTSANTILGTTGTKGIKSVTYSSLYAGDTTHLFNTGDISYSGNYSFLNGTLKNATTSTAVERGGIFQQNSTDALASKLFLYKSRGTNASPTVITTGDTLGKLIFNGYDGATYRHGASITALSSGTIGTNRVPGNLIFSTATDAAPGAMTEVMRLNNSGQVGINTPAMSATNIMMQISKTQNDGTIYFALNAGTSGFSCSGYHFGEDFSTKQAAFRYHNNSWSSPAAPILTANTASFTAYSGATGGILISAVANAPIKFATGGVLAANERWQITGTGILQSNGAQTIQANAGSLTIGTASSGDILLTPAARIGINTTPNATTGFGSAVYLQLKQGQAIGWRLSDGDTRIYNYISSGGYTTSVVSQASATPTWQLFNVYGISSSTGPVTKEVFSVYQTASAANGRIMIGTSTGSSLPTYNLTLTGQESGTIGMERQTTAATAGQSLTISSGGAVSGGANLNAAGTIIKGGITTGSQGITSTQIQNNNIQTVGANATTDNSTFTSRFYLPSTKVLIDAGKDTLFSVVLGADSMFTANISYGIGAKDGTDRQTESGTFTIAVSKKAGSISGYQFVRTASQHLTSGTLTPSLTIEGTATIYIIASYTSSLTVPNGSLNMDFTITNTGGKHGAVTFY